MIIYNVTVKIDNDVHDEWLEWMTEKHIPEVMETRLFIDNKICRIMVDDPDGVNYSIQYTCLNLADYKEYQEEHAPALQQEHTQKFKDRFVAFRTLLEVVE